MVTALRLSPIAALRQPRPSLFRPPLFLFANMAENAIDSDLYGDIYGDDEENEYEVATQDPSPEAQDAEDVKLELPTPSSSSTVKPDDPPPPMHHTLPPDAHRGLPPKPAVAPPSSLSYSAQVAKQFSVYQQTPSQERQQRREIPLPPNPRASAPRPAAPAEARPAAPANPGDTVFGKKPSEMHDAG
ncbi:hypothetical protein HYPSUDRAFT_543680 [Hypholoma sublateritium FD-334 SS-4]|uniref:Uncharacterized protein n=1 Tax=Hypholoma sublateritium (strain FD-334 SS-4) TaxID=945553 RepID=A0A0D2NA95_HYPSF|nr:hypothetical protein HYPSUDRAFT_543680 [Hypholoma sublateritium FD-334 SS-4]